MRLFLLLAIVVALAGASEAHSFHALPGDPHYPTTTVAVNGGGCSSPECRWIKIIDRTGFTASWWPNVRMNALAAVSQATGYRFNFTIETGPRFNLWVQTGPCCPCPAACEGYNRVDEAFALTPPGAMFIPANSDGQDTMMCDDPAADPDGTFPWTGPQPYCGAVPPLFGHHAIKSVGGAGDGTDSRDAACTFRHELGHSLGLNHRWIGAPSVMVGDCQSLQFDSHDRAELQRIYAHTP